MVSISRGSSFLNIITISLIVIPFASLVRGSTSDDLSSDRYATAFLNRTSFPAGFVFGTASSAYQYEGAANESGRGPSIWDTFTHKYPGKITDGSNGDVAIDSYHRYKEDVGIMKEMGLDVYRFSISWSRVLPKGKISGGVNKEGIEYYNNLINELLANGIKPFVTLFHWDLPQTLQDEHGGFLSPHVVKHFEAYAELCYKEFGDRVKHWITFNEPIALAVAGYGLGALAPGRCSTWINPNCTGGNSATEPYLVTHYQLLAHAAAVNMYKKHYQESQKGLIGITLVAEWLIPNSTAQHDQVAAFRALDFIFGWYMDPLTNGDYPKSMRSLVGDRLPKFKKEQSKLLKGSFDFIGLNYYTSSYVSDTPQLVKVANASYMTDSLATMSPLRNGIPIGPKAASEGLYIYPRGIRDILLYTKRKYNNPLIYITENGVDEFNDHKLTLEKALADNQRIDYHFRHLYYLRESIKDGVNVKGYFAWSLLDNFEWTLGYTVRFGINYVDYKDGLKRYPKHSAIWFKNFLKKY
ncbi:putative beta-glucosidase [Rosa chinensis]|uniref:Putative beta-glucosidase n=1 Tax=Rosa chinensis TaxID=74649 RepID=A0A2P6QM46_ROSCH|nr:beta-glucosidase 13 [Rosa chinensis]PRQ35255.1 putative beta-glucosidase [Rosa chinensis]